MGWRAHQSVAKYIIPNLNALEKKDLAAGAIVSLRPPLPLRLDLLDIPQPPLITAAISFSALKSLPSSSLMLPPVGPAHSPTPLRISRPQASPPPLQALRPLGNREGSDGPRSGVARVVLSRVGLRGDVLHLRFLLPGAGLLRGWLPEESATATTSQRQPETPGKPGRTARSPGPAAGLPGTVPPPPRDGCNFPRS